MSRADVMCGLGLIAVVVALWWAHPTVGLAAAGAATTLLGLYAKKHKGW